ncbi:MAG: substrate-binding and VWA domain-containing protein [Anaerolineae bacterium]|nr:substrate-binding and VWA domain-containing protein [Anaerolineae bacterium]
MQKARSRLLLIALALLTLSTVTCTCNLSGRSNGSSRNGVAIEVTANTALTPWLETVVKEFNKGRHKTSAGRSVHVVLNHVEAGRAVKDILDGHPLPALWIPDDPVWVDLLAERGYPAFQGHCLSVAQSPLVIAMWRPLAEVLGWPGRPLGWLDIGSLAADPSAWAYYSGGQFGDSLRLGHTHPGLSGSGASTLLAIVQAAQARTEAVSADDIRQPIVQASVGAFEAAVSWFSPTTDELGRTMRQRGMSYLGAAIMYESTVVHYGSSDPALVPIYPLEGTFIATHPACVNSTASAETQEAATLFRSYLLEERAQQAAVSVGLRPVAAGVTPGPPLDKEHGVDLEEPKKVFGAARVEALYAAQELWQAARKSVNLVMLLDVSGSMEGEKIEHARAAAIQFVEQMGERDFITLITFSAHPQVLLEHEQVATARERAITLLEGLEAQTSTALYDAIAEGAAAIARTSSPQTTNAIVLLSDGVDTSSVRFSFGQQLIDLAAANDTIVCAIAYGDDADEELLSELAVRTNGRFYRGDEANIAAIYDEIAAAFGGSAGIGR